MAREFEMLLLEKLVWIPARIGEGKRVKARVKRGYSSRGVEN
jgi:hypothetical protein